MDYENLSKLLRSGKTVEEIAALLEGDLPIGKAGIALGAALHSSPLEAKEDWAKRLEGGQELSEDELKSILRRNALKEKLK